MQCNGNCSLMLLTAIISTIENLQPALDNFWLWTVGNTHGDCSLFPLHMHNYAFSFQLTWSISGTGNDRTSGQKCKSGSYVEIVNFGVHRFGRLPNHTLTGLIVSTWPSGLALYSADSSTLCCGQDWILEGEGQNPTPGTPKDLTAWEPIAQADWLALKFM